MVPNLNHWLKSKSPTFSVMNKKYLNFEFSKFHRHGLPLSEGTVSRHGVRRLRAPWAAREGRRCAELQDGGVKTKRQNKLLQEMKF